MTTPHLRESDLPQTDLVRLDACGNDRHALMALADELVVRVGVEVDEYHQAIEAEINATANQIALAVDDLDDTYHDGLVRHIRILQNDQMHFSVTSRPSSMLHEKVMQKLRDLNAQPDATVH